MYTNEYLPDGKKPLILIVDDILKNLQVLGTTLIEEGYEISMAQNGFQALKLAEKIKPDLILLDVLMPDMTGFETCAKLKENEELSGIPVIFLTAKTETEDIITGFQTGGVDYITKPFKKEELLMRIKTHLDLRLFSIALIEKNENLARLNKEKNEFLGIAAHDLKNPLSAIKGLAEMTEKYFTDLTQEEIIESAEQIRISSEFMFQIIMDLLDINAIEEGRFNLSMSDFELDAVLQMVVNKFNPSASAKKINLNLEKNCSGINAYADAGKTQQILDNLISNAIKFSPFDKNIWINSQFISDEKMLRITVKDEGPGISEEDKTKLFKKFSKLSARPTNEENSTGLGLSIVKRLVEEMKGKIWCESQLGAGSSFIVEFPMGEGLY
jgi:signal transduction histidine kinase